MDLDLPRETFAIQRGPHKRFRKFDRPAALDLLQSILLNHVSHLLLLLFAFVQLLLEIIDLFRERVETVAVGGPIADGANESGIRVLKWLDLYVSMSVNGRNEMGALCPPSFQ